MYTSAYDPDRQPLFYFRGLPVRLAVLLVVVHVTAVVVQSIAGPASFDFLRLVAYRMPGAEGSWPSWWQWGTWFLANGPSVWFLLDMLFLAMAGTQLEMMMGRKFLIRLYLALIALPSVLAAISFGTGLVDIVSLATAGSIHFSLFMAIAFLHPDACFFFCQIKVKYVAGALFGIYLLSHIYTRNGFAAGVLIASVSMTYAIMRRFGLTPRFTRVAEAFAAALPGGRKKQAAPLPYRPKVLPKPAVSEDRAPVAKIDAILDKISRSGIDSLDEWERRELERSSRELKRQDNPELD